MDISDELLALDWPDSFVVVYRDGTSERLLRGSGITVSLPGDEPDGFGAFCADIPKKHPQNQKQGGRHVRFIDLDRILDDDDTVLFQCPSPDLRSEPNPVAAHRHSSNHRVELERSVLCGCFYCMSLFPPSDIAVWIDEIDGVDTTALCPSCSIDSVIGSASGYPITTDFLNTMHQHWF